MIYRIDFTKRISGYYKISYRKEFVLVEAEDKKHSLRAFEDCITSYRCVIGSLPRGPWSTKSIVSSELGSYYMPRVATDSDIVENEKMHHTFEPGIYTPSELRDIIKSYVTMMRTKSWFNDSHEVRFEYSER